jgi:hypothetical protein
MAKGDKSGRCPSKVPALSAATHEVRRAAPYLPQGAQKTETPNDPFTLVLRPPHPDSPWGTYLMQVDRVVPYLGHLARWVETLKRPKRALIVDIPIELDDGAWPTSRATACSTT